MSLFRQKQVQDASNLGIIQDVGDVPQMVKIQEARILVENELNVGVHLKLGFIWRKVTVNSPGMQENSDLRQSCQYTDVNSRAQETQKNARTTWKRRSTASRFTSSSQHGVLAAKLRGKRAQVGTCRGEYTEEGVRKGWRWRFAMRRNRRLQGGRFGGLWLWLYRGTGNGLQGHRVFTGEKD